MEEKKVKVKGDSDRNRKKEAFSSKKRVQRMSVMQRKREKPRNVGRSSRENGIGNAQICG
jgi:hypothetical protein